MGWKETYAARTVTAEEALSHIKAGDRAVLGHACGEPVYLVEELIAQRDRHRYRDVEIVQMVPMGPCPFAQPGMEKYFHLNTLFVGGGTRKAVAEGRGDFTPCSFSRVPQFLERYLPPDVALIQVTPPDENGNCSLGVSVDYTLAAAQQAKVVIAQVNDQVPYVYGNSRLPVEAIDFFVPHSQPLPELRPRPATPAEARIGRYCAALVEDGATLQLGIGAIPDAVLSFLGDKRDLGVHSELLSDGVVDLIRAGVINNSHKTLFTGKSIATFLMGTRKLYDFVDHNPDFELHPVDMVNEPSVIRQNDRMISINSCVQIDLTGQVNAESVGYTQISGMGGQMNFVYGAIQSEGGKSIIAMTSTTADGKHSKIVPVLDEGAAVTTVRTNVDYIVTEYGVAQLAGKSLRQRAKALIAIAHPDFRPGLEAACAARFGGES